MLAIYIALLWSLGGFLSLPAAASAQTAPSPTVGAVFNGTYAFVSQSKVNETYVTAEGLTKPCGVHGWTIGPLVISDGHARYTATVAWFTHEFSGTVGSRGELMMKSNPQPSKGGVGTLILTTGIMDGTGGVTARQNGPYCRFDLVWRKMAK